MPLEGFHDLGFLDLYLPKLSSTGITTYMYKVKCHFSDSWPEALGYLHVLIWTVPCILCSDSHPIISAPSLISGQCQQHISIKLKVNSLSFKRKHQVHVPTHEPAYTAVPLKSLLLLLLSRFSRV